MSIPTVGFESLDTTFSLCYVALPTETKVESGTSQSRSGISVNFSDSEKSIELGASRVSELIRRVRGVGFRVQGSMIQLSGVGVWIHGSGFRVWTRFRVENGEAICSRADH